MTYLAPESLRRFMGARINLVDDSNFYQYPENPKPYFMAERIAFDMRVPDEYLDCVVFVGVYYDGIFTPHGTGFIAVLEQDGYFFQHIVTARHVIDRIALADVYIRINLVQGGFELIKTMKLEWMTASDKSGRTYLDVAAFPVGLDTKKFKILNLDMQKAQVTPEDADFQDIGIGEDVFFMGLHTSHIGKNENIPVIRFGNLSAISKEPYATEFGYVVGYLVEVRSIGGSSGSPVFISIPPFKVINGCITQSSRKTCYFLGLMVGTWITSNPVDSVGEDERVPIETINTGIAIVIPVDEIIKFLNVDSYIEARAEVIKKEREKNGKEFRFTSSANGKGVPVAQAQVSGDEILRRMLNTPPSPRKGDAS